jgi:hypothetical protein
MSVVAFWTFETERNDRHVQVRERERGETHDNARDAEQPAGFTLVAVLLGGARRVDRPPA